MMRFQSFRRSSSDNDETKARRSSSSRKSGDVKEAVKAFLGLLKSTSEGSLESSDTGPDCEQQQQQQQPKRSVSFVDSSQFKYHESPVLYLDELKNYFYEQKELHAMLQECYATNEWMKKHKAACQGTEDFPEHEQYCARGLEPESISPEGVAKRKKHADIVVREYMRLKHKAQWAARKAREKAILEAAKNHEKRPADDTALTPSKEFEVAVLDEEQHETAIVVPQGMLKLISQKYSKPSRDMALELGLKDAKDAGFENQKPVSVGVDDEKKDDTKNDKKNAKQRVGWRQKDAKKTEAPKTRSLPPRSSSASLTEREKSKSATASMTVPASPLRRASTTDLKR